MNHADIRSRRLATTALALLLATGGAAHGFEVLTPPPGSGFIELKPGMVLPPWEGPQAHVVTRLSSGALVIELTDDPSRIAETRPQTRTTANGGAMIIEILDSAPMLAASTPDSAPAGVPIAEAPLATTVETVSDEAPIVRKDKGESGGAKAQHAQTSSVDEALPSRKAADAALVEEAPIAARVEVEPTAQPAPAVVAAPAAVITAPAPVVARAPVAPTFASPAFMAPAPAQRAATTQDVPRNLDLRELMKDDTFVAHLQAELAKKGMGHLDARALMQNPAIANMVQQMFEQGLGR